MIMKKRQILFLTFLVLCAGWILALSYYRLTPVSVFREHGAYGYIFNHSFSEKDVLKFKLEEKVNYIEIHFSNHFIMRYVDGTSTDTLPSLARWKDSAGRTRILPVVTIKVRFDKDNAIAIGRDYCLYAGSVTRGLKLEKIASDNRLPSLRLTNMPFQFVGNKGCSFLKRTGEFSLRKIEQPATIEDSHVQIWEYVYPSEDGKYLAVSSFDGYVYYLESASGKLIWRYHIPDGRLSSVSMSDDGKYVFVGEHSADGNVYCFNADSGSLVWKYATAKDVGSFYDSLSEPGLWSGMVKPNVRDVVSAGDTVFARTRRTRIVEVKGKREKIKISKIYAFTRKNGAVKWTYPKEGSIERYNSSTLNLSRDGRYVSLVTFEWESGVNPKAMIFDAENGNLLWEYQCDAAVKYFKTPTCYAGLIFSPDSRYGAMFLNDGRIIIFDHQESIVKKEGVVKNVIYLTSPIEAGTVPVMTYMSKHMFTRNNDLIVATGQTYTTPFVETKIPPVSHPNATSVFGLDIEGGLLWRFTGGGNPSMFDLRSRDRREYLAVSFSHNVNSQDINEHGFYIFDLTKEGGGFAKTKAFYHTEGICVTAQLSPDLSRIFAIEAVIDMDDSIKVDYRGKHRVIFFDLNDKQENRLRR